MSKLVGELINSSVTGESFGDKFLACQCCKLYFARGGLHNACSIQRLGQFDNRFFRRSFDIRVVQNVFEFRNLIQLF